MRIFVFCLVTLISFPAWAVCTLPDGVEGEIIYNQDVKVVQYCDGTRWIGVGWKGGGSQGAVGDDGQVQYVIDGKLKASPELSWDEDTHTLTIDGFINHKRRNYDIARPICYSASAFAAAGKSVIVIPYSPSHATNLNAACQAAINSSWSALGVVKGAANSQNCHLPLDNDSYDGGYTSFVAKNHFQTNAANYNNCNATNAVICCSI